MMDLCQKKQTVDEFEGPGAVWKFGKKAMGFLFVTGMSMVLSKLINYNPYISRL